MIPSYPSINQSLVIWFHTPTTFIYYRNLPHKSKMSSNKLDRPLSPPPDPKEYAHLSEKERMLQGYPYLPMDPVLLAERVKARKLTRKYNNLSDDDQEERKKVLKELLHPDTSDNVYIEPNFRVDYGYNIKAGNNLQMNFDCCILDCALVEIGDNCLVAPGVHIYAATHPIDPKYRKDDKNYFEYAKPVKIGNNVWIGGHATICPGVTIGDNVVIGAGSVVTKDVPKDVVVAGNPARIVRNMILSDKKETQNMKPTNTSAPLLYSGV